MSRTTHAYAAPDLSALAKSLKRELEARADKPGHVELLNMLTRAVGFRNYQHFKASRAAEDRLARPVVTEPEPPVDFRRVELAARCFAGTNVLVRWPGKLNQQQLALWVMWSYLPAGVDLGEKDVNAVLMRHSGFGDHVLLRRELVNMGLLSRTRDCRLYRRIEKRSPPEARELIRLVTAAGSRNIRE
ncbi:hypothetical protein ASE36_03190 [Rhizobium sp. Root274]|uniref:DUF2087 domain-containing protein n=1 Tax=unclassified Rhizobium TaxID=2613769 RepID=UPI000716243E|nr:MULTISPECIES: DUF2087 domain-containing protein [unclassified Rhizobium]KQW31284.1 hypothetical protein ASC71_03185 [Rhizobium sp. Root1240]KRD32830.1 hypothetical protein ASE36_03190 [Rhizobium sp. Root274]